MHLYRKIIFKFRNRIMLKLAILYLFLLGSLSQGIQTFTANSSILATTPPYNYGNGIIAVPNFNTTSGLATISIISKSTNAILKRFDTQHAQKVSAISMSKNARYLAVGSFDFTCSIWDLTVIPGSTPIFLKTILFTGVVNAIDFSLISGEEFHYAVVSNNGQLFWSQNGAQVTKKISIKTPHSIAFTSNPNEILIADRTTILWFNMASSAISSSPYIYSATNIKKLITRQCQSDPLKQYHVMALYTGQVHIVEIVLATKAFTVKTIYYRSYPLTDVEFMETLGNMYILLSGYGFTEVWKLTTSTKSILNYKRSSAIAGYYQIIKLLSLTPIFRLGVVLNSIYLQSAFNINFFVNCTDAGIYNLNGVCQVCQYYCETCSLSKTFCNTCAPGFTLSVLIANPNVNCLACTSNGCRNCLSWNTSSCTHCFQGFIHNPATNDCTHCLNLSQGCTDCTTNRFSFAIKCQKCQSTYFLENGACLRCNSTIHNCIACSGNGCIQCEVGSYLQNGICLSCIETCASCINSAMCTQCPSNFTPKLVPGTSYYDCTCQIPFILSGYTCGPCQVQNCKKCSTFNACLQCDPGFTQISPNKCSEYMDLISQFYFKTVVTESNQNTIYVNIKFNKSPMFFAQLQSMFSPSFNGQKVIYTVQTKEKQMILKIPYQQRHVQADFKLNFDSSLIKGPQNEALIQQAISYDGLIFQYSNEQQRKWIQELRSITDVIVSAQQGVCIGLLLTGTLSAAITFLAFTQIMSVYLFFDAKLPINLKQILSSMFNIHQQGIFPFSIPVPQQLQKETTGKLPQRFELQEIDSNFIRFNYTEILMFLATLIVTSILSYLYRLLPNGKIKGYLFQRFQRQKYDHFFVFFQSSVFSFVFSSSLAFICERPKNIIEIVNFSIGLFIFGICFALITNHVAILKINKKNPKLILSQSVLEFNNDSPKMNLVLGITLYFEAFVAGSINILEPIAFVCLVIVWCIVLIYYYASTTSLFSSKFYVFTKISALLGFIFFNLLMGVYYVNTKYKFLTGKQFYESGYGGLGIICFICVINATEFLYSNIVAVKEFCTQKRQSYQEQIKQIKKNEETIQKEEQQRKKIIQIIKQVRNIPKSSKDIFDNRSQIASMRPKTANHFVRKTSNSIEFNNQLKDTASEAEKIQGSNSMIFSNQSKSLKCSKFGINTDRSSQKKIVKFFNVRSNDCVIEEPISEPKTSNQIFSSNKIQPIKQSAFKKLKSVKELKKNQVYMFCQNNKSDGQSPELQQI